MPNLFFVSYNIKSHVTSFFYSFCCCLLVSSVVLMITMPPAVKPLSLKIRGPSSPVVAGEMVSLTCFVEGARPAASISWYNRSELLDPQPLPTEEVMEDATFR